MKSNRTTRWIVLIALCSSVFLCRPGLAVAQSESDLRKQNQQLAAQVQDLQKELKAAQDRLKVLEAQITQLQQQLAAARAGGPSVRTPVPPLEPEKVTIDERVPHASPRALLVALVTSYQKAVENMEIGKPGDGKRRAYIKKLEGWKASVDREFRGPITWHVRVLESRNGRGGERTVALQAVDPVTGVVLGDSFDVLLSTTVAERLAWYEDHGELEVMVLRGTLVPDVRINEQRESRGSFDNPPFIGPFGEFVYSVEVKSLTPAKDEKPQPATKPAESKDTKPAPKAAPKPAAPATPEKP